MGVWRRSGINGPLGICLITVVGSLPAYLKSFGTVILNKKQYNPPVGAGGRFNSSVYKSRDVHSDREL